MQVKVSLILPSLNVAPYMEECLKSAVFQSLREIEILCVDAGSTDGTTQIIRRFAAEDARIRLLHSPLQSYGRQVNLGLDQASGEYVAVLETDDFVHPDMYGRLYEEAAFGSLDQVSADYDTVFRLQSGAYHFTRQCLFRGEKTDWYGAVLDTERLAALRACDHVLWKGIYNRAFLNAHNIRLHESSGAAFQDMGFLQQTKTYVTRATYLNESFYRYRVDRREASSANPCGLRFYEEEFRWLERGILPVLSHIHRIYYSLTMSIAFLTKYEQILAILKGAWEDERLSGPYAWFSIRLREALESGLLSEELYSRADWERLNLLLHGERAAHACLIMAQQQEKERPLRELARLTDGRPVVIFGCGRRGEKLMLACEDSGIPITGFCDNNPMFAGGKWNGFAVHHPTAPETTEGESLILLSMKNGRDQARSQLLEAGVREERIAARLAEEVFQR